MYKHVLDYMDLEFNHLSVTQKRNEFFC